MFGKKKDKPQIDPKQLELFENAQHRIKQKKQLYYHAIIFLIGSILLIIANVVLGIGKDVKPFDIDWFVYAILIWLVLFLIHLFNVFFISPFMGRTWEKQQIEKLVGMQQRRVEKLKKELKKEALYIAESEVYNESLKTKNKSSDLTIIVAAGENNAIGKDNKLIWHLSDDLRRFKTLTSKHHIIMGRKTFESFPKPLPNRTHVVITRQPNYQVPEGVIVVNSLEKAIEIAKNDTQPFIIGGGQIYQQAMALADKIELTRVHAEFEADTFFPEIDTSIWKETNNISHNKDKNNDHNFSFVTYVRQ